jgi:hypothetical protein
VELLGRKTNVGQKILTWFDSKMKSTPSFPMKLASSQKKNTLPTDTLMIQLIEI